MSEDPFARALALEGVSSAFAASRDGVDALLCDRGLPRRGPSATAESLLRGAHASAALEGSTTPLEQLRLGEGDATASASVRLSTQLLGLLAVWQRAPVQALARMHSIVAASQLTAERLGRPTSPEAAERLHGLARSLRATSAPGMLQAAIVHAEVAAGEAFGFHNGLVARAAERLVLIATGVDPASVTVPEAGHLRYRQAYFAVVADYRTGERQALRAWLLHAADAYAAGADAAADLL